MGEDEREDRALRLPMSMLERASALIPRLEATPWGEAVRWNATAVVRLGLSRGLAVIEDELAEFERRKLAGEPTASAMAVAPARTAKVTDEGDKAALVKDLRADAARPRKGRK